MNPTTMNDDNSIPQAGSSYDCSSYTAILNELPQELSSAQALYLPKYPPPELPCNGVGLAAACAPFQQHCIGSTSHGDSRRSLLAYIAAEHTYDDNGLIYGLREDIFPSTMGESVSRPENHNAGEGGALPLSSSSCAQLMSEVDKQLISSSRISKWVQGNTSSSSLQDFYVSTVDPPKRGLDTDTGFADHKAAVLCSFNRLPSTEQHAQGYPLGDYAGKTIRAARKCANYAKMQQPIASQISNQNSLKTAQESSGSMLVENGTIAAMPNHAEKPNALLLGDSCCSSPIDNPEVFLKQHCMPLSNSDESMGLEAFSCGPNGRNQAALRSPETSNQFLSSKKRTGQRLDRGNSPADIEVKDLEAYADDKAKRLKNGECEQEQDAGLKGEEPSNSGTSADSTAVEAFKGSTKPPEVPKPDYIHVRARRGQATDSHSLAERVRREKISERMKYLQDLVPNCNKVTGKAVMLDEIINYVQSLQRQVEFLSMKLASVNPRLDFSLADSLFGRKMFESTRVPLQPLCFARENVTTYPHPPSSLQVGGTACLTGVQPLSSDADLWTPIVSRPPEAIPSSDSQISHAWDDDLQNVVQMGFMQGRQESYLKSLPLLGKGKLSRTSQQPAQSTLNLKSQCPLYIN